jgi:predicted RNA-binding Zn ribbon-like protein
MDSQEGSAVIRDAIQLREAIYRIVSTVAGGLAVAEQDLVIFNRYLGTAMQSSEIIQQEHDFVWNTKGDPENLGRILNPLVRSAADLLVAPELRRVKKCGDPACGWLFLDTSRNLSRRWCDMRDCGNRAKASRFYKKRKKTKSAASSRKAVSPPPGPVPNIDRHLL